MLAGLEWNTLGMGLTQRRRKDCISDITRTIKAILHPSFWASCSVPGAFTVFSYQTHGKDLRIFVSTFFNPPIHCPQSIYIVPPKIKSDMPFSCSKLNGISSWERKKSLKLRLTCKILSNLAPSDFTVNSWRQHLLCPSHTALGEISKYFKYIGNIKNFTWNTLVSSITNAQRQNILKMCMNLTYKKLSQRSRTQKVYAVSIPFLLFSQSDRVVHGVRNQNSVYFRGRKKRR